MTLLTRSVVCQAAILLGIFRGIAPGSAHGADLLPDLVVREMELLDHDLVTDGERVILRLATATANIGAGPVEVVGVLPVATGGHQWVNQVVFRDDGSRYERPAGSFEFHPTHHHVHLEDWAIYRLREFLDGGGVGAVVAEGGKTSFCLVDSIRHDGGLPGASGHSVYTSCHGTVQGISVGWADYYHRRLYGQNIDVKGLPQSRYWLEVEVDPENHILEADEGNNVSRVPVEIGDPVFVSGPIEVAPDEGSYDRPGRVDLRVGYRRAPHFQRGNNTYFPEPQVLQLSVEGRGEVAFFSAVENEDEDDHHFLARIRVYRSTPFRWIHFETTGSTKRNVTAAVRGGRHLLHLDGFATGTFHSIGKRSRRNLESGRGRNSGLGGLFFRVAEGALVDRARIDLVR